MTLPTSIIFPSNPGRISSEDPAESKEYMRELISTLTKMYEDLAENANGSIRGSQLANTVKWSPVLKDKTNTSTTFTYDHAVGWVFRQGLMVEVWFDIQWTAASGTTGGAVYVELPYTVATTSDMPFIGLIQASDIAYTAGTSLVISGVSNTLRGEIWTSGNGSTSVPQTSLATGQLIGHFRYLGKQNE